MASSKLMASSNPRNSDLTATTPTATTIPTTANTVNSSARTSSARSRRRRRNSAAAKTLASESDIPAAASASSRMNVDGILRSINTVPSSESTLLDAQMNLFDSPFQSHNPIDAESVGIQELTDAASVRATAPFTPSTSVTAKTYDEVWREIVAGRSEMKEEPEAEPDEMMTLEDFLAKAGAVDVEEEDDVKMSISERLSGGVYGFDGVPSPQSTFQMLDKMEGSIIGFGSEMEVGSGNIGGGGGRGKRGRSALLEPLDKAAQQRQRRMIKNRESAARSRERKQAYQMELETLAMKLEEENEQLLREKEERTNERLKQLMEKVVPVVERRRPKPALRRLNSTQW